MRQRTDGKGTARLQALRMDFKDYYATLGVERTASQDVIKRAYRKLARKYHPDVSKEADAEATFKEVAEAHEALIDPERRAAYDELALQHAQAQAGGPSRGGPQGARGWDGGYEFSGRGSGGESGDIDGREFSSFFASLFGQSGGQSGAAGRARHRSQPSRAEAAAGADHHARIDIDLIDAYLGARHTISLRHPVIDAAGHAVMQDRKVEVNIPKGVREGQHLRLAGLGEPGQPGDGDAPAGDLYLEIGFRPHARFRIDGADVWTDLPIAPWEAALGATVTAPTPEGDVALTIPAASVAGRKLRLKGKGLPGQQGRPAGDLYAVLQIVLPPPDSAQDREAYAAMARAFTTFNPREPAPT